MSLRSRSKDALKQGPEFCAADFAMLEHIIEMDDDDTRLRRHNDVLPVRTLGTKRARTDASRKLHGFFRRPPHVPITNSGGRIRIRLGAFRYPLGRHHLLVTPFSAIEVEPSEARKVAGGEPPGIGGVLGRGMLEVAAIRAREVFRLQRSGKMFFDRGERVLAGRAPNDRTEHTEL